jgi:hypothetical protein
MPGMEDAWVRVRRAHANFDALKGTISTFRREHPDNERVDVKHVGKLDVRLVARIKQRPPHEWGLAAGDILVDLRCALDYAVYALAIAHTGQNPPPYADKLEFPICRDTKWSDAIGRHKLAGVSDAARDWIESVQPYQPGNGGDNSGLVALEELVGINKHRFIYVAWVRLHAVGMRMRFKGMKPFTADLKHIPGELKDGAELVTFHLVPDPAGDRAEFEIQPTLSTFVAIEPTGKGWLNLVDFLGKMGGMIDSYLAKLESFL